jgi:prepilin-type processing-associated H-X9-DG protein
LASDLRGVFNRLNAEIRFASVSDGLSNTIFAGEVRTIEHDHGNWDYAWTHYNGGASHVSTIVPINQPSGGTQCNVPGPKGVQNNNWNVSWGFKSYHSQGANFMFGDGSVRFLREGIEHRTYQLLGCRNDGLPVTIP